MRAVLFVIPRRPHDYPKYYKLLIHLGLTSVKFSAIVADWDSSDAPGQGGDDNSNIDNNKDIWLPSNVVVTP